MALLRFTRPGKMESIKDIVVVLDPKCNDSNVSAGEFQKLKNRLEKSIPKMHHPEVAIKSFVGLDDVKEEVLAGIDSNFKQVERILLYGPMGSGKSHLAAAICTQLNGLLFTIDKTTFHDWSKNMEVFTQIFTELASECNENDNGRVILLLENFDWFYDTEEEMKSVVGFLKSVQNRWAKLTSSQLLIVGCICEPWTLDKTVIESFQKRVYLRSLNFQERKQLIQKRSCDLLRQWGLDMTDRELCGIVKRAGRFVGWQVCEMVDKAFKLQCPPHIKRHLDPRPLTKIDFEVTLDRMPVGGYGKEMQRKYEEFNSAYGDKGSVSGKTTAKFEDKGIQVEMKKLRRNGKILSKFFGPAQIET